MVRALLPVEDVLNYLLPLNPKLSVSVKAESEKHSLFVEVDPVVMHATSITAASRVLPVFACRNTKLHG